MHHSLIKSSLFVTAATIVFSCVAIEAKATDTVASQGVRRIIPTVGEGHSGPGCSDVYFEAGGEGNTCGGTGNRGMSAGDHGSGGGGRAVERLNLTLGGGDDGGGI